MSDQNDALTIGRRIKSARKACKLRQSDVAQAVGVHMQTISKWERGLLTPDARELKSLCGVLGCSADYLLGIVED